MARSYSCWPVMGRRTCGSSPTTTRSSRALGWERNCCHCTLQSHLSQGNLAALNHILCSCKNLAKYNDLSFDLGFFCLWQGSHPYRAACMQHPFTPHITLQCTKRTAACSGVWQHSWICGQSGAHLGGSACRRAACPSEGNDLGSAPHCWPQPSKFQVR